MQGRLDLIQKYRSHPPSVFGVYPAGRPERQPLPVRFCPLQRGCCRNLVGRESEQRSHAPSNARVKAGSLGCNASRSGPERLAHCLRNGIRLDPSRFWLYFVTWVITSSRGCSERREVNKRYYVATGNASRPRTVSPGRQRSACCAAAKCRLGRRSTKVWMAICPSSRARGAPTQ